MQSQDSQDSQGFDLLDELDEFADLPEWSAGVVVPAKYPTPLVPRIKLGIPGTDGMVGLISAQAAELYGTIIYATPDGREVHVTIVVRTQEQIDEYGYDDKQLVGPLDRYVGKGLEGMIWEYEPAFNKLIDFHRKLC